LQSNGVNRNFVEMAVGQGGDAVLEDQWLVWDAAEVALALLRPGYLPKREAVEGVRKMLAWYDSVDV
jgi:hypothetical protein